MDNSIRDSLIWLRDYVQAQFGTSRARAFRKAVKAKPNIFQSMKICRETVSVFMVREKIPEVEAEQMLYALKCRTVFEELGKGSVTATSANNMILSLREQYGMNDHAARSVVSDLLYGIGSEVVNPYAALLGKGHVTLFSPKIYIPTCLLEKTLAPIREHTEKGEILSESEQSDLEVLKNVDVTEAWYLSGFDEYNRGEEKKAEKTLRIACEKGSMAAHALLGDLAYQNSKYSVAEKEYRCLGSIPLTSVRKDRIVAMEQDRMQKRLVAVRLACLALVLITLMVLLERMNASYLPDKLRYAALTAAIAEFVMGVVFVILTLCRPYRRQRETLQIVLLLVLAFIVIVQWIIWLLT